MCGIIGSINIPFDKTVLNQIRHRGPDGDGLTHVQCGKHRVFLGHLRLAIVDLSDHGAQPMTTAQGLHQITFNGEVYNHMDIRAHLPGCSFHGHSDTETLLQMLSTNGVEGVDRLNGIFAFGYLDLARRKLFLVRDPFGVKPLYYSIQPKQLCFASEIAPLRNMVDFSVDPDGLAALLKLRFVPSPRTLYSGIRRLRPGHILEVDLSNDELAWTEYPFLREVGTETRPRYEIKAAIDDYGLFFEQAVTRQLMADVEIGVLLSGGIDSALVAAAAQRKSSSPLKAFTVGYKGTDSDSVDEIEAASETARLLGMEHLTTRLGFDDFIKLLEECVHIVEEPLATTSIVPMHFLSELAGNHVKVVLSGQGADEVLGGYRRYQSELWRRIVPPAIARTGACIADTLKVKDDTLLRGLRALSKSTDISRFEEAYAVFTDEEILRLTGRKSEAPRDSIAYYYELLRCDALPSSVERMMSIDARFGLADDLLLYTDKMTMRHSLECRVPLLDRDLVAFIESLPHDFRLRLGKTKIVHKAYAKKILPSSVINRPKKGFLSPTRDWFKNEELLRSLLLDKSSRFASHVDVAGVEKIIQDHQIGFNRERQIFLLLCLFYCLNDPASRDRRSTIL